MKNISTTRHPLQLAALAGILLLASGCQLAAAKRARIHTQLDEESRALTTAVVEVLQAQPTDARDAHTSTALELAKQDQRIEGLPVKPIDAPALLVSNAPARDLLAERFARQNELIAREHALAERLTNLGAAAEEARRARRMRWARFSTIAVGTIGGLVALAVFCPIAVPLLGRFLGWLVAMIPGAAKATGVVSVKAFDAVVRAIEKTRRQTGAPPASILASNEAGDGGSRRARTDAMETLLASLSSEMDASHKALVRARRAAF